jgi:hypothetical protein
MRLTGGRAGVTVADWQPVAGSAERLVDLSTGCGCHGGTRSEPYDSGEEDSNERQPGQGDHNHEDPVKETRRPEKPAVCHDNAILPSRAATGAPASYSWMRTHVPLRRKQARVRHRRGRLRLVLCGALVGGRERTCIDSKGGV